MASRRPEERSAAYVSSSGGFAIGPTPVRSLSMIAAMAVESTGARPDRAI
jgi:hypothetical protein